MIHHVRMLGKGLRGLGLLDQSVVSGSNSSAGSSSDTTMSTSVIGSETYPGQGFSLSQLLYAAKMKLQDTVFGGGCVHNPSRSVTRF